MNWYLHVLTNYAAFSGRARRTEYWYFALYNFIFAAILYFVGMVLKFQLLYELYLLATLIPSIAVLFRRLHDTGRSGWWWLIAFVPFVGAIVLIVFCVMEGQNGPNQYGPDPRSAATAAAPA